VEATDDGVRLLGYYNRDDDLGLTRVRALLVDDDGTIWAGGPFDRESPLSWFDGQEWHYDFAPLAELAQEDLEVNIWSLLRSSDGSLWLGLVGDGILRWDGENWRRWGPEEGVGGRDLDDARIRALFQDDRGTIWAAASQRGLLRYRPEGDAWEQVGAPGLPELATAITQFSDGTLWAGGETWVARSDDSGATWTLVGTSGDGIGVDISGLAQDDAGRVWLSAYEGGVSLLEDGAWRALQR
jgi:ligand-binding sensor domain-containing protein